MRRYTELVAKHATPVTNLEMAQTQVGSSRGAVKADEAAIENLQVQLSFCTIRAPIDGRVGIIAIKAGNSIKANDLPLVIINQIQPIVERIATAGHFPGLKAAMGGPVEVSVRAQGDEGAPIKGLVEFSIARWTLKRARSRCAPHLQMTNSGFGPNQYVNASVTLGVERDALTIPQAAVRVGQNSNYVFVIKPDRTAEFRPVNVDSYRRLARALPRVSVKGGEEVAVGNQLRLNNGTKVEIKKL